MVSTPLKNLKVNWDDEIPTILENQSHVPVTTIQDVTIGPSRSTAIFSKLRLVSLSRLQLWKAETCFLAAIIWRCFQTHQGSRVNSSSALGGAAVKPSETFQRCDPSGSHFSDHTFWYHALQAGFCLPGWWLSHPSEKYEFVSWDGDIPFPIDERK